MTSVSQRERAALVATLNIVGPEAPTLCEGWTAKDMAAHLVLRERRLDATAGIAFKPLANYTAKVQDQIAESTPWDDLVGQVASGPPIYSPFKLLDSLVNGTEMFVHHEDLRRAQPDWAPRELDAATLATVRRPLPLLSRVALSKVPARLTLQTPDGQKVVTVGKGPEVVITGEPGELLMFAFGRNAVHADFSGDAEAIAAVKAAKRGL
ncbi:MAG: TIGR03085 family metal-binding protein [Mycobacterium sp.]